MLSSILGALKRVTIGEEEENGTTPESDSEEENERIKIPMVSYGITRGNVGGNDEKNRNDEDEDHEERIQTKGIITTFDYETNSGVIDRLYTFKSAKIGTGNVIFDRGDKVDFEAVRSRKRPKWEVICMKHHETDQQKANKEICRYKNVIAKVIRVTSKYTEVEAGNPNNRDSSKVIQLPNRPQLSVGFPWLPGDWLQLQLENLGSETSEDDFFEQASNVTTSRILSIAPVQRKTVVGKVTKRNQNILIDDSIYYTQEICKTMFPIGTVVKCEAISSDQSIGPSRGDFVKWRAIKVQKSNFLRYTERDPNTNIDNDADWQNDDFEKETSNRHQELMYDKCGIVITPRYLNFPPLLIGASHVKTLTIKNTSQQAFRLEKIHFNQDPSVCQFEVQSTLQQPDGSVVFLPNDEVIFNIRCVPLMIGRTTEMCVFDFGSFMIARNFTVTGKAEEEEKLVIERGSSVSSFKKQIEDQDISKIITDRGRRRVKGMSTIRAPFFSQKQLPRNAIPNELFQIMKDRDDKRLEDSFPGALAEVLNFDNYKQKFHVGLWFEEMENHLRCRQNDLHGVRLNRYGSSPVFYKFQAEGIQDFHPPVNLQDSIDVYDDESETNTKFQGTITKIIDSEVTCIFGEAFDQQYTGFPLTVQFNLGRNNYKRCHFAVETAVNHLGEPVLFPSDDVTVQPPRIVVLPDIANEGRLEKESTLPEAANGETSSSATIFRKPTPIAKSNTRANSSSNTAEVSSEIVGRRIPSRFNFVSDTPSSPSCSSAYLNWFNTSLNEEQKDAVRRIIKGQARPLPYIIFGPPGTGKTVTLVEAIMQVNKLDLNSRILVCAPSNAAADIIAEYLANSKRYHPGEFIRLNGFMRSGLTMPESIAPYCTDGEDLNNVAMHRLIVSTCITAGQFFSLDLTVGHFTHVFIDEAGYCTEPETMVPACLLALSKSGQLILAGDPNQLGPVLMSDISQSFGLDVSFLERIMKRPLYRRDQERFPKEKYNPLVLTKLVKNYRAHPTLLKLPSRLFYDDDLESRASYEEAHALCQDPSMKNILVSEGVPLIFHGIQGSCSRERDSPSWFNKAEAIQVVHYVATLLGKCGLRCGDIGIITPYRKQVEKIRLALQMSLALNDDELPKVASVEEFQGGERKVIIISTVRSANENIIEQQLERLGFLYQPKRFNVAITRAKALMIVVGNPFIISKNTFWLQLLRYALDLNAYKGCNLPIHLDRHVQRLVQSETNGSAQNDEEKNTSNENGSNDVGENETTVVYGESTVTKAQDEDFHDAIDF